MTDAITLRTDRLTLATSVPTDAEALAAFHALNRAHLAPWEPPRPTDFATADYWYPRIDQETAARAARRELTFLLRLGANAAPDIIGYCRFSNIIMGPFRACYLGYALGEADEGQGLMSEALRAAIEHIFAEWGLHRIMANYVPTNERSAVLLKRLGFVREGYAKDYLFIDGAWRDHVLMSLTNPDAPVPA